MPAFQDRESTVSRICDAVRAYRGQITVITGEAGIGKTSVLDASARQIRDRSPTALVVRVDFRGWADKGGDLREAFLRALVSATARSLAIFGTDPDEAAYQIALQLNTVAATEPAYLFFDTTESLQSRVSFWRWLEEHFLQPLISVGQVRIVFAGRVAPPFQLFEVRRALDEEILYPIDDQSSAMLAREVLRQKAPAMPEDRLERAVALTQATAFGHPLLTQQVAAYIADNQQMLAPEAEIEAGGLACSLCEKVVDPFVQDEMLRDVQSPWAEALPWITILNWFDTTILEDYLKLLKPDEMRDQPDDFFIKGVTQLLARDRVVWNAEVGCYQIKGVLGAIVRHCLAIRQPEAYRAACVAATRTFEAIAEVMRDDPDQAQFYKKEADTYRALTAQRTAQAIGGGTAC